MAGFDGSAWDEGGGRALTISTIMTSREGTTSRGCGGHEASGRPSQRGLLDPLHPVPRPPATWEPHWYVAWMEAGGAWMGAAG